MNPFQSSDSLLTRLVQAVLGMLGVYAALRFLPRLLRSLTKKFVLGLIGEILLVALSLFLTDRARRGPSLPGERREQQ